MAYARNVRAYPRDGIPAGTRTERERDDGVVGLGEVWTTAPPLSAAVAAGWSGSCGGRRRRWRSPVEEEERREWGERESGGRSGRLAEAEQKAGVRGGPRLRSCLITFIPCIQAALD